MLTSKVFLSLILASLAVVGAHPLGDHSDQATLGISIGLGINASGPLNIVEKDRDRAYALRDDFRPNKRSTAITNAERYYTAQVGIGNPATYYTLLIDTGSSNTWIRASKYIQTSTSYYTGNAVSVTYRKGRNFSGKEWTDTVTLTPGLVVMKQSIGVASSVNGIPLDVDGILGMGPLGLTSGTVSNRGTVPTVMDNLYSQGTIPEKVFGVYSVPYPVFGSGKFTLGGYDNSVITSPVNYVPLTRTPPASGYWGIDQSITYGEITILSRTAGIVDTGTAAIYIASDAFEKYKYATGATKDPINELLSITARQYANLKMLSFNIGDTSYHLSPDAQIWPRSLNHAIAGSSKSIYLVVTDIGRRSGKGFDFIIGYPFFERYYSVFDSTKGRVGFAPTAYTYANVNYYS